MEERIFQLALSKLKNVGVVSAKALYRHFGSSEAIFNASKAELKSIPQIGEVIASSIIDSKQEALVLAEGEYEIIQKNEIQQLYFTDKAYPNRLNYCNDAPTTLFYKGTSDLNSSKIIAMVGTRKMTSYGKRLIKDFLFQLKDKNIVVVSGLAFGVDSEVHKVCVEYGIETIGVLAHGLDTIYPAQNRKLAEKMILNGGLLTEFFTGTKPDRQNFPTRNRIVAGMCDATIVVESDRKGGSLITAEIANSYKRDVFAFPGEVGKQYSQGCNNLIKYQKALLLEDATDCFNHLGWSFKEQQPKNRQRQLFLELNDVDQKLVKIILEEELTAELISVKSSLPLSLVHTHLLNLELQGVIRIIPGNKYAIN